MSEQPPPGGVVFGIRKFAAAIVGLIAGVLVAMIAVLIVTVVRTEELAESNNTRLRQQTQDTKVGLDILCKLKKYDLTTGLPALKARREHGPEYDPQRALVLERALLLVLSIPSSETCLAIPEPSIPKSKRGPSPKSLLRRLEQTGTIAAPPAQSQPPNARPRIEREATRKGASQPGARGPRGGRGPAGPSGTPTMTVTSSAPATPTTPTSTTPAPPVSPAPPPVLPEPFKKRVPLGLCVEALGVRVPC